MKTAVLLITDLNSPSFAEETAFIDRLISEYGLEKETLVCVSRGDDIAFTKYLLTFRDIAENLLVFGADKARFDFKPVVAEEFGTELSENENAVKIIEEFCRNTDNAMDASYAVIPYLSTVIPNKKGYFQGFLLEEEGFSLAVFPSGNRAEEMFGGYFVPYVSNRFGAKKIVRLKYFGNGEHLASVLKEAEIVADGKLKTCFCEKYSDCSVKLIFDYETDKKTETEVLRLIGEKLEDGLYADRDVSLAERLYDLLTLKKKKISTAESFTAGRVVAEIIKTPGASKTVHEGIVSYSNESKKSRLGVNEEDLKTLGAVSSRVAYEMALGLLQEENCDVALSTTGIAGPKSDDTLKPVGLCYIAVGTKDGVHVYKRQFDGNREEITEKAKNAALFLAMNNLKKL